MLTGQICVALINTISMIQRWHTKAMLIFEGKVKLKTGMLHYKACLQLFKYLCVCMIQVFLFVAS